MRNYFSILVYIYTIYKLQTHTKIFVQENKNCIAFILQARLRNFCVHVFIWQCLCRLVVWCFLFFYHICSQCKSMQDKVVKRSQVRHTFASNEAELHVCIHAVSFFLPFCTVESLVIVFYCIKWNVQVVFCGSSFCSQQLRVTLIGTMKGNIYRFQSYLRIVIQFVENLGNKI